MTHSSNPSIPELADIGMDMARACFSSSDLILMVFVGSGSNSAKRGAFNHVRTTLESGLRWQLC